MSVEAVIARLRAIDRQLPDHDGVRWFNQLYLTVTIRVHELRRAGGFEEPAFMERLDEIFAELYFEALDSTIPAAWLPLLQARADTEIAPGRFMLAGVNAHVNYDLPIALVRTCGELGGELAANTPRHRDFERIDAILGEVENDMHAQLDTSRLTEVIALWGVIRSRGRAWDAAIQLARSRGDTRARDSYLRRLGNTTADWSERLLHMPA